MQASSEIEMDKVFGKICLYLVNSEPLASCKFKVLEKLSYSIRT